MKNQKFNDLREKAKEILKSSNNNEEGLKHVDNLIEELSIYQIELEMQNDELLQTQDKLEKEQKKFRDLYEYAPVAYITVNATGNIIDLNYKAAELFGKPKEVFNFNSIFPFIDEDSKTKFRKFLLGLFDSKVLGSVSIPLIGKDGELIFTKINGQVFEDTDNDELVVRLTLTDIVAEKEQHDDDLVLQEIKYSEIFNNTLDALFLFPYDEEGNPGSFAKVNSKACSLFNMDCKEILTLSPEDFDKSENIVCLKRASKELLKSDQSFFEMVHKMPNGKEIPLEINAQKFVIRDKKWGLILVRDITERKVAEEKIKESEQRYRLLAENMNDTIIFNDMDFNVVYISPSIKKITGYDREEYSTLDIEGFLTPESHDVYKVELEKYKKYISDPKSSFKDFHNHLILNRYHKDGHVVVIEITQSFLLEGNEPKGIISVLRDVTNRHRNEQKIKETNLRLEMAMEVGNLGWWEWDYESNVMVTAPKKPELLGYDPDKVSFTAQDYINMIHPDDYERAMQTMRDHLTGKTDQYNVEYRLRTKLGDYKWLYDVGKVFEYTKDKKPKRLMGVIYDISDRKAKEEKIIKSEHDLTLLLSNLDDIVFEHTEDSTFINVWTNNEEGLFMPKDRIIGCKPEEVFPKEISSVMISGVEEARQTGKSATRTFKGFKKGERYYLAKVTPYKDEYIGEIRFVSLVRDITERRRANLLIQKQNEELEELNATKDKFFSIISHDLKNPFNTILGFSNELMENYDKFDKEERLKQLKIIHDSARQNFSLLQNLLTWSGTQSNRIPYKPDDISLTDLIDENFLLFTQSAQKKNIQLRKQVAENKDIHVYADSEMMNTSIRNLISNAIKYTSNGGEILIGCQKENKDKVRIFVKDNGVGIASETIPKLFKIDETFSMPGTEHEQGTGLGLILVKEFVEQNNGTIQVESEQGKGTQFSIMLNQSAVVENAKSCFTSYDKISQKILNLSGEQRSVFKDDIIEKFDACRKTYSSRKVERFSQEIEHFSKQNNLAELLTFVEEVKDAIRKFDISKLNFCFDEFRKVTLIIEQDMG